MEKKILDKKHISLQFLMMLISIISFLVLTIFVGNVVWIKDFQYFVVLISGVFAMFIGVIALLRYYTQKESLTFLLLGVGFLVVGILDVIQLILEIGDFVTLFMYRPGEIYPFSSILSRGFLSILIFFSWFLGNKKDSKKITTKKESLTMLSVVGITLLFGTTICYLVVNKFLLDTLWVVVAGILTMMFLLLSFVGYMFRKNWKYDNFDFWLIFAISFLLLSQVFFLPFLNIEYYNMVNLSIWAKFFAYLALLIGFLNSIYEMYQNEILIQKELKKKNMLLDATKKKVEEAYLVIRKEKWDLINEKSKKKSKVAKKK